VQPISDFLFDVGSEEVKKTERKSRHPKAGERSEKKRKEKKRGKERQIRQKETRRPTNFSSPNASTLVGLSF